MKITISDAPLGMDTLARMAGGTLALRNMTCPPTVSSICTDSREADGTTLLCAIRGERVDGHRFLPGAAHAGCVAFLCERLPDGWSVSDADSPMGVAPAAAIVVPDTVCALGRLVAARRTGELAELCAVAITGSVGKTTTKELVSAVLRAGRTVFKKDGNYNSTIGLPLSVMEIPSDTEVAVLEMGMSARGEIASMTASVRPDIAVITNIGTSHLEHLGTRENIACAKLEIAVGLRPGGVLLVNGDEPLLAHPGQRLGGEIPTIPEGVRVLRVSLSEVSEADFNARTWVVENGGMRFDLVTPAGVWRDLWIPAMGEHLVWAGAFAAAVGQLCGLTEGEVRIGLASYRPAALRQSTRTVGGVTLIEDCYNAAPESMRAALGVLELMSHAGRATPWADSCPTVACPPAAAFPDEHPTDGHCSAVCRVAVLGDMRELGADTEALHKAVGAEVARHGVERLVTVGALGRYIAIGAAEAGMPAACIHATEESAPYAETAAWLCARLRAGDVVLFKASRAMELESLSAAVAAAMESSSLPAADAAPHGGSDAP